MKNFTLLLLFILTVFTAQAQNEDLRLGAKAGFTLANISDDRTIVDSDAGVSSEFGVFARIGEGLYIQTGLDLVSNKVTLGRVVQPRPGERDIFTVRYLRAPVHVGLETDYEGAGISRLRFMAGPAFNYALGVKDNNLDIHRRNIRKAQFSLSGGIGIAVLRIVELDLMYHHGISKVFNDDNADGKYRNFSLTLGFSL